jgi:hypothetical protein
MVLGVSSIGLYSCGGTGGNQVADGGIGGTGITQGRVTNFGSIFVNGIEFNTDNANFIVNDLEATQSDLAIGMVVSINGDSDASNATGNAVYITYDSLIEGVVTGNNITNTGALEVMNQTVSVNDDTVYVNRIDNTPLENLPLNSEVEISGFTNGSGTILATRIEVTSLAWSGGKLEISGVINALSGNQFQIGGLTIDASSIETIPSEGTFVEVEGDRFIGDLFVANAIEIEGDGDQIVAKDGHEVEIEGQITQTLNAQDLFALNGQVIDASSTPLSGAIDQLTEGRIAKVKGIMNSDILLAESIELSVLSSVRGEISGLLGANSIDFNAGTVTLLGKTIIINNSTILENDSDEDSRLSLDQLTPSDYLEAKVYLNDGQLVATKLELEPSPSNHNAEVEGIPSFIDNSTIEIYGIRIDTSGVNYSFINGATEVKGNFVDGVLIASDIEFENSETDDDSDSSDE